jgi:hypothetical protein
VEAEVDRSDASALADLQMHWDEAYAIGLDGDIWSATFRGSADELRAHTSTELRELIRADYAYRQQVRRVRAAAAGTAVSSTAAGDNDGGRSGEDGGTRRDDSGPDGEDGGTGSPGLEDDDLDDDDYAAHFDGTQIAHAHLTGTDSAADIAGSPGDGRRHDTETSRHAGLSQAAEPHGSYAKLRGERMST